MQAARARKRKTAWIEAREIEKQGQPDVVAFLKGQEGITGLTMIGEGTLSLEHQKRYGDGYFNDSRERFFCFDIKVEFENKYRNFFLETWSNRSRLTEGWFMTTRTNFIMYYFLKSKELYVIPTPRLKRWAFGDGTTRGRLEDFQEREQRKYDQLNDTWGRCPPIKVVTREVKGIKKYDLNAIRAASFHPEPTDESFGAVVWPSQQHGSRKPLPPAP